MAASSRTARISLWSAADCACCAFAVSICAAAACCRIPSNAASCAAFISPIMPGAAISPSSRSGKRTMSFSSFLTSEGNERAAAACSPNPVAKKAQNSPSSRSGCTLSMQRDGTNRFHTPIRFCFSPNLRNGEMRSAASMHLLNPMAFSKAGSTSPCSSRSERTMSPATMTLDCLSLIAACTSAEENSMRGAPRPPPPRPPPPPSPGLGLGRSPSDWPRATAVTVPAMPSLTPLKALRVYASSSRTWIFSGASGDIWHCWMATTEDESLRMSLSSGRGSVGGMMMTPLYPRRAASSSLVTICSSPMPALAAALIVKLLMVPAASDLKSPVWTPRASVSGITLLAWSTPSWLSPLLTDLAMPANLSFDALSAASDKLPRGRSPMLKDLGLPGGAMSITASRVTSAASAPKLPATLSVLARNASNSLSPCFAAASAALALVAAAAFAATAAAAAFSASSRFAAASASAAACPGDACCADAAAAATFLGGFGDTTPADSSARKVDSCGAPAGGGGTSPPAAAAAPTAPTAAGEPSGGLLLLIWAWSSSMSSCMSSESAPPSPRSLTFGAPSSPLGRTDAEAAATPSWISPSSNISDSFKSASSWSFAPFSAMRDLSRLPESTSGPSWLLMFGPLMFACVRSALAARASPFFLLPVPAAADMSTPANAPLSARRFAALELEIPDPHLPTRERSPISTGMGARTSTLRWVQYSIDT